VYTREIQGKEIELGVSGKLYKDALVMFDRETGTLWTQVNGSALRGPLEGHHLEEIPALQTSWKTWKTLHPDTLVLQKPSIIQSSPYADYFTDPERRGLFGTRGDTRLPGKAMVVGVHDGPDAAAAPLSVLAVKNVLVFDLNRRKALLYYSRENKTAAVFRASVDGRDLTFHGVKKGNQELLEDDQTKSLWLPLEGRAVRGPLKGRQMQRIPYMRSFWYAWSAYRPDTRLLAGH